jgi:predicted transcriptional regulator of viral defense system
MALIRHERGVRWGRSRGRMAGMSAEFALDRHMGGEGRTRRPDRAVAALAARQHGVVSRAQLRALGLGDDGIDHRLAAGRLFAVRRGVYAVGHRRLAREGRWMACVLAAGRDAVLSHGSAAALWGIRRAAPETIDVTTPRRLHRRAGLQPHRALLAPDEVTRQDGIPVTTAARTLLDLAAVLTPARLERAVEAAEGLRLADSVSLAALLGRYPRRRGSVALTRILGAQGTGMTRSELEDRFLDLLANRRLPRPQVNARLGPFEVDCLWPEAGLVAELDGRTFHAARAPSTATGHATARCRRPGGA